MKRNRDSRNDDSSLVAKLKVYRVNKKLGAGDVVVHDAATLPSDKNPDQRCH